MGHGKAIVFEKLTERLLRIPDRWMCNAMWMCDAMVDSARDRKVAGILSCLVIYVPWEVGMAFLCPQTDEKPLV